MHHSLCSSYVCAQDAMVKQAAEDFDKIISALEELFDVFIIAYADSAEQAEQFTMYVCMYVCMCSRP